MALSAQILPNHQLLEQVEIPPVGLASAGPLSLVEMYHSKTVPFLSPGFGGKVPIRYRLQSGN